jgi:glycosyltransferase involved in cell wall biosynthesis
MDIKVSVIMCAYNAELLLRRSIESVLGQSMRALELIIIDDASTDSTPDIIREFAEKDVRIVSLRNDTNLGPAVSRNKGIKIARGKFIAVQDADDTSLKDRLMKQYAFLENHPDIFLVGGGMLNVDPNGTRTTTSRPITDEDESNRALPRMCTIVNSTIMFRNTKKVLYREKFRYAMDYDLFLLCLTFGKRMINLPDPLIERHMLPGSISFANRLQQRLFAKKAIEFYHQRILGGKDGYGAFDPAEVLNVDIDTARDPELIGYEIEARFKVNDPERVRELYSKYLSLGGSRVKYLPYYVGSFLPPGTVNFLRRIVWR